MRKPDDDLKIDISDLFGGELSGPSDTLEEAAGDAPVSSASTGPASAEAESQFKQWMDNRAVELEAKSLELERRHQQAASAPTAEPVADTFTGGELLTAPPPSQPPPPPASASPIDFNEPIAPPFSGLAPVPVSASKEAANTTELAAAQPAPEGAAPAPNPEELKKNRAELEFLMLYDEFRNIIIYELKDLVGEKKTFTMLTRTVELAREKYPMIFRNANWNADGNLLEDGGVDSHRLVENKNALDPQKADETMDMALSSLLKLRLQAVEKGLGTGLKNKIRARMYQWISEKNQKAAKEGKESAILKRLNSYVAST